MHSLCIPMQAYSSSLQSSESGSRACESSVDAECVVTFSDEEQVVSSSAALDAV
jgi:hypothetical protein